MGDVDGAEQPTDPCDPTALEALHPLATSEVEVTPTLRHREFYTRRGLLTVLTHEPPPAIALGAAIVACGGALGGVASGLQRRLAERV